MQDLSPEAYAAYKESVKAYMGEEVWNERGGNKTYMLQLTDKHNNTLMVELSGDGTYWNINTAGIFKTSYGKNRKEVYNRHTTAKQSTETTETSRSGEQSGTQALPSMVGVPTPSHSASKGTTTSPENQTFKQENYEVVSGVVPNELSEGIATEHLAVVDAMAKMLGVRITFVPEVRDSNSNLQNAKIVGKDIYIAAGATQIETISFLTGHEFTHRMKELSPEQYAKLEDSVRNYLGNEAWEAEMATHTNTYRKVQRNITDEEIAEEVVADFIGRQVRDNNLFTQYLDSIKDKGLVDAIKSVLRAIRDFFRNINASAKDKALDEVISNLNTLIESASAKAESAENTEEKFSARLSDRQIATIIEAMKTNAEVAPQIELTPENWTAEFGAEGVVSTPIGEVKMSANQYQKMEQPDRRTKLGMVKPTLTNPDVIIEEPSKPKDGRVPERNSSYVFVKAFTNVDGSRDYMFTSVSNLREGIEIVMSNQEKETPRIKRLLKEGKLAYINKATLPSEFTASAQGDQSTIPSEVSYSESKDTTSSPNMQEEGAKFSIRELDAPYLDAVERGDMETAQRMVLEAAKRAMPNTKVVDENGNPKVVYHGSNAQFTVFDTAKIGSTTGTADGRGFYFTTDKDYARGFVTPSGKLFGVFLNIENPLSYDRKTITKAQLKKILKEADKVEFAQEGEHYMLSNYANYTVVGIDVAINEASNLEYGYADNDVELIGSLIGGSGSFELIMNAVQKVTGKSGMIAPKDNDTTHYIVTNPSLIKSADPVTYDDNGSVIPLSERFNPEKEDIRYSVRQPIFYSNAEYAVRGIKQEKATPEQWLKMIENNGGLKAGEDKWLGLSDWLKASDKKTLTKDEVLQYIAENDIQIEEVEYAQFGPGLIDEATRKLEAEMQEIGIDAMREKYDGFDDLFEVYNNELVWSENKASEGEYEDFIIDNNIVDVNAQANAINETRINYTTNGLTNKREIALVVPTIEPWNTSDNIHFGDAGEGRAVAWIRFGETTDAEDKRVLVIDEIQSKRHQEGREKGYRPIQLEKEILLAKEKLAEANRELGDYKSGLKEKYDFKNIKGSFFERHQIFYDALLAEERAQLDTLAEKRNDAEAKWQSLQLKATGIPSAPFEKNWAELAMKRMLRYAAENGFDKMAWTTGDQQADRYNIGTKIERIEKTDDYSFDVQPVNGGYLTLDFDEDWIYRDEADRELDNKHISEIFGKDAAKRLQEMPVEEELSGDGLRIGGEGMKAFYDQMLPSFVRNYAKKWGATVGEVTMPDLEENNTMHAVDVTDAMRESVMQGQPKFSLREVNNRFNEELATLTEENKDKINLLLGMPSDILLAAGVVNKPMKLYGAKLWAKSQKHGYKVSDLRDLPKNVAAPIAIFKGSTDGSHAVLTEIKVGEDNVLATLSVGKGGEDIDFNIISSVYGKQSDNVVKWIDDGKLEYIDKEKALNYLHHSAPIAEALSNPRLISTTKVIQNFENPKIEPKYYLRELDASYLDAVEHGDMEAANKAVAEAALEEYDNGNTKEFIDALEAFVSIYPPKVLRDYSGDKATIEETFGGIWIEDTEEFAKFVSAVNKSPFEEDGEGIAYTDNYFYAYYRNVENHPVPYASVYLNKDESQDVVNQVNEEIGNVRKGERAKFYFDRAVVRFGAIEGANNANIGGNQSTPSTVRDSVVVQGLLRKGGYYDNPNIYVKTSRTDRGRSINYSLRELDAPYLDAVERGDMEAAQKMVLEAAKLAMPDTWVADENGNPRVMYHGDRKKARYIFSTDTFFTPNAEYARRYINGTGDVVGDVYHALIPIIKENLEIQKQLYNGERGNHIVLGRGVSKESNDPQQEQEYSRGYNRRGNRPLESQPRVLGGDREGEASAEDRGAEVAQRLSISQKLTDEKAEPRYSFQDIPFFVDDEGEVFYFNDDTEVTDRPRNVQLLHYNLGELVPRSGVSW